MKKKTLFFVTVLFGLLISCSTNDNSIETKIKRSFNSWAKTNIEGKYKIVSILYDTIGTPFDYIYKGFILNQTVGSSGKTDSEGDIASNLIMLDAISDSTYLTKDIIIAEIDLQLKESDIVYYIGIRGDSICSAPKQFAYEALKETHREGEQKMYEAIREIKSNIDSYLNSNSIPCLNDNDSENDFYDFWKKLPGYKETMQALGQY